LSMRILRVVHRLYPPTVGGLSLYAHRLSAEQAELGRRVVVLTTQEGGYPIHEFKYGYEIYRFKPLARPLDNPLTLGLLPKLLLHEDFDILHAHSHLMFTTSLAAIKKRLSSTPLVVTNHGFSVKRGRLLNAAQSVYLSSLAKFSLTAANCVISFTEAERKKTILAGVKPNRAVVIPNGVDTRFFLPAKTDSLPRSVLWFGRFVPEKGLRYLIEAARIVTAHVPDATFILVGGGGELPNLVKLRNTLGLRDNIIFYPEIDEKKILGLLNSCTLFALPSLSEGFPSAVLEAMSCKKPVVITAGIGLEEVVGRAGLYVPARDPIVLAKAIEKLLRNEGLANELGERGRSIVEARYDWRKVVRQINTLFEKITEQRPA
jgi:alpha-maltose-1-phosphate synthase